MADDKIKGLDSPTTLGQIASNDASQAARKEQTDVKSNATVDQKEFLQLLVHQLQNQDPLNPMENQEFAVQLAQFSQLEQLVDINRNISNLSGGGNNISSMASYLGHEVVLRNQFVQIAGGKGPNVLVDMPGDAQSGRIDLMDTEGQVVKSYEISSFQPGKNVISLGSLDVGTGAYEIRAVAVNSEGQFVDLDAKITGTVEGFVVEPEPSLIVNGEQVKLEDVVEVYQGSNQVSKPTSS
jgi:flagellar basal-body rod modification protein FlgD